MMRTIPALFLFFLAAPCLLLPVSGCKKREERAPSFVEPPLSAAVSIAPREGATATALSTGEVVVAGGFGEDGAALASVSGIGTGATARALPPLPAGRARHGAAAIEGGSRIAIAGGLGGTSAAPVALASTLLYDPLSGAAAGPDLPAPLSESGAVFWDGGTPADPSDDALYLIGGRDGSGALSSSVVRWTLAPSPGTAAQVATLAAPRAGHSAVLCPGPGGVPRIHVMGGDGGAGALATTEFIDPASGTVSAGPDLPEARARHAAAPVGNCAAILLAGGLGADGAPRGDAVLFRIAGPAPDTFAPLGGFGPPSFDLLALPQADGSAVVLGGFTAFESGTPAAPSREAALFVLDAAGAGGEFIDLPDFDLESGAGGAAGAARPGNGLGAEGTGSSIVIAGGRGSGGELRTARSFNPYGAASAREHDLLREVGPDRTLVGAAVIAVIGVIERTREYGVGRLREIDLERLEDPLRGTVVKGAIGEFDVDLELDGGVIHGMAAGIRFTVFTRGDQLRGDGVAVDLRAAPGGSIRGRYFLSWKRNSVLVQLSELYSDRRFEGRIAAPLRNVAIETEDQGTRVNGHRSFLDSRLFDLGHSR